MGKNWSLIARTRSDHQLVRNGPFAIVRHPIYLALPLYLAGTAIRIRDEEALLRAQFGEEHARYAREVPALIPLIL
jgi:protein-S-isoprenylcysteine O-methyltransferase Ste14